MTGQLNHASTITINNQEYPADAGDVIEHEGRYFVVLSGARWWCEDPLSYGVMSGKDCYLYNLTCRPATDEEAQAEITRREEIDAKEAAEKNAKRTAWQAEQDDYKAKLANLRGQWEALIVGLEKADKSPSLSAYTAERVGSVCEPGRGASFVLELTKYTKATGEVVAVAYGEPCGDMGMSYWVTEDINRAADDRFRTVKWTWWYPQTHGADSYPGPGVPVEELTPEELEIVEGYYAAQRVALIEKQAHSWRAWIKYDGPGGEVEVKDDEIVVTVPPSVMAKAKANLSRWNDLNEDKNSRLHQKSLLPVTLKAGRELAAVREAYRQVTVSFPEQPVPEKRQRLKAAGFKYSKGAWSAIKSDPNIALAKQVAEEFNKGEQ